MQLETANTLAPKATDVELARAMLFATPDATCVAVKDDEILVSYDRGVKPLLKWIAEGRDLSGFSIADKVVGKAPALLYAILGPVAVFAPVMTRAARATLLANQIACGYDQLADQIQNRAGNGQCPIDASVANVFDPYEGMRVIRERIRSMMAAAVA